MPFLNLASSYPVLAGLVLIGAFGAPLPLNVAVATAAALARQGHMHISLLFVVCVAAAVAGDCLGYALGRGGIHLLSRSPRLPALLQRRLAGRTLPDWLPVRMGALIFLTRWALTAPAPLVNVLAGARRYNWRRFLLVDLSGEALWCLIALLPGYALGGAQGGLAFGAAAGVLLTLAGAALAHALRRRAPMALVGATIRR